MIKKPPRKTIRPSVTPLEPRQLLAGPSGIWLGQDGHDYVGPSSVPAPDDVQDIHIALSGLPAGRPVSWVTVDGYGGGAWQYDVPGSRDFAAALLRSPGSTSADLFIDPYQVETGRHFDVDIHYGDGGPDDTFSVAGGAADPNLRMPQAALHVAWVGQDGSDFVGAGPDVGPDGIQDAHLVLTDLSPAIAIRSATITGPGGLGWAFGTNHQLLSNAEIVTRAGDPTTADLYINPGVNLAGMTLTVSLLYADGKTDGSTVVAGATDPALAVAPTAPVVLNWTAAATTWIGQDGQDLAGLGSVRASVAGIPAGRTVVAATLTDQSDQTWVDRGNGQSGYYSAGTTTPLVVKPRDDGSGLVDLSFQTVRDESASQLTARLTLDDGTVLVSRFAGGPTDVDAIAPAPAMTSVVAHPGDDLNALANAFGSVHLSAGTYTLTHPLVLNQPVAITSDPGVTLVFAQDPGDPAWTAAIKIRAGRTTLDGFAVRFSGPVRWSTSVNFGPAVIGTTDNLDPAGGTPLVGITLTHLDLLGPAATTGTPTNLEAAIDLIRLATATSGTVASNTLNGGTTEFDNGPWSIVGNTYTGTPANTYSFQAFAGHYTFGVDIERNTIEPAAGSGKIYRAVVLTQAGLGDTVAGNTIVGVGAETSDVAPIPNTPETILTEAYRLHFEGTPSAVSAGGLVVQIPAPQGEPAAVGDVVSILSGPSAGQYRRIAQAISPTAYILDSPLPAIGPHDAIAIASGFIDTTISGNTIDERNSTLVTDLVLAGDQYGATVSDNHFLGGGTPMRITADPTELPVQWGWSNAPFLGATISGNTFQDAQNPSTLDVIHSGATKLSQGRVFFTATLANNTSTWSAAFLAARTAAGLPAPTAFAVGDTESVDPGELMLSASNNLVGGPAGFVPGNTLVVTSGTINGQAYTDGGIALPTLAPPTPTGLRLVVDSGTSATDGLTDDGHLRIDPPTGSAVGFEYRVNGATTDTPVSSPSSFLPAGLVQGSNTVDVRSIDAAGDLSPASAITFTYKTTPPAPSPIRLDAGSDTGRSQSDAITSATSPAFAATAAATDTVQLLRDGSVVATEVGPGTLRDPGPVADGVHAYSFRTNDAAGNVANGAAVSVTVHTTPPDPVTGLSATTTGLVTFRPASATDWYEYRLGTTGPFTPIGAATSFTPAGLAWGLEQVQVHAVDVAGNLGRVTALKFDDEPTQPAGTWLGQDGHDLVGRSAIQAPDGYQDIHIALSGLPANRTVALIVVLPYGGGEYVFNNGLTYGPWKAALVRSPGSTAADLYLQPDQAEAGRKYNVQITYDDGTSSSIWLAGGPVDPSLTEGPGPGGPNPSGVVAPLAADGATVAQVAGATAAPTPGPSTAAPGGTSGVATTISRPAPAQSAAGGSATVASGDFQVIGHAWDRPLTTFHAKAGVLAKTIRHRPAATPHPAHRAKLKGR